MNDQIVHLLKLTTGEEVMCKLVEKKDTYEMIDAVSFRWGLEYDENLARNVERLQPSSFPVNASLGRYDIKKENVMLTAPPRQEAITVYHGFVASVLNYTTNQPNPNS